MFCPKCGTQLEDWEAFCHNCGHRMTQENPVTAPPVPVNEPAPVEETMPVEEQEEVTPPKKKSRKKLIIGITAAVTALAVGIGAVAFYLVRNPKVYLRTKITEYDKNGDWARTVEYSYNDQGSPTEIIITSPAYDHVERWDETYQGFRYDLIPNGGEQIRTITYEYNDQGHCLSYEDIWEEFDANGTLVEKEQRDDSRFFIREYKYDYNKDGTVDTIANRTWAPDEKKGDYTHEYVYHYDDDGRLHEISEHSLTNDYESTLYDFRYDSKDRLTVSTVRKLDGVSLSRYEYDKDGNLEKLAVFRGPGEAPFDDENITGIDQDDWNYDFGEPEYEEEFQYDKKGRLISRGNHDEDGEWVEEVGLEYDGKFLSRVVYADDDDDEVIKITDDEAEAKKIARKMDENDVVMVRDKHGNIIKVMMEDGSYAEYEYEAVRLAKKYAEQHKSIMVSLHTSDLYKDRRIPRYNAGCALWSYVSFPTNELYEIEVLLRILDGNLKY